MSQKQWEKSPAGIKKDDVGKYVRVWFEDIGHVDSVLVEFDEEKEDEPRHRVFLIGDRYIQGVNPCQITWKGGFVLPPPCEVN
jgi:hypothetical protein